MNYTNEVEEDVAPFDVCIVVFGIQYMYMRNEIFNVRRETKYHLIKDMNSLIINAHKDNPRSL